MQEPGPSHPELTQLLRRAQEGDAASVEALAVVVQQQLHRMAELAMQAEPAGHTLQPTALVNEAWIRIFPHERAEAWRDSRHFLAAMGKVMRNVLVDHARARHARKRGDGARREPLDAWIEVLAERQLDVLGLHEALQRLARLDDELERIVELHFFAGLTLPEVAQALGLSLSTVERGWRTARTWLHGELGGGRADREGGDGRARRDGAP